MAKYVEYCSHKKPPQGYRIYRSERGRYFWVCKDEDPPEKYSSAVYVGRAGEFDARKVKQIPKKYSNPMDRIKSVYGEDIATKKE